MSRIITGVLVVFALFLTACGGGSSSSGASQAGPAPTQFAGTYQGEFVENIAGVGQATTPVVITVTSNGRVILNTGNNPATCIAQSAGTPFLEGNRIRLSLSGSCFIPGVGTCQVSLQGEIVFSATNAVGSGTEQISCPGFGTFNGTWGLGATRVS